MAKLPGSFSVASASMFCFPAFSLTLFADTLPQIIYFPSFHLFLHIICIKYYEHDSSHPSELGIWSFTKHSHSTILPPPAFNFSPKCHDVKLQIETRETRKHGHSGYATSPTDGGKHIQRVDEGGPMAPYIYILHLFLLQESALNLPPP